MLKANESSFLMDNFRCGKSNQPLRPTQPGHPFISKRNEYQLKGADDLRLSVKAGMARAWRRQVKKLGH